MWKSERMSYALLIDDNEGLVDSIKRAVTQSGLKLETASSWDEGLALFHALGPELVIADYHMPGSRHGLQLLWEIKVLRPSVQVVLLSAYINDEDVEKILSLDLVDGALRKLDLRNTMESVLSLIEEAEERARAEPDWSQIAKSTVRVAGVSQEDFDELDSWLNKNRFPGEK
jgi:DNA-binding NtrC family response regulator